MDELRMNYKIEIHWDYHYYMMLMDIDLGRTQTQVMMVICAILQGFVNLYPVVFGFNPAT